MTELELLRSVPAFKPLADDVLKQIVDLGRHVSFAPGTRFITQGQIDDDAYLIVEGEAEISVRSAVVAKVGPGSVIGEVAAALGRPRTASVTATSSLRALVITKDVLKDLMRANANFASVMTREISRLG